MAGVTGRFLRTTADPHQPLRTFEPVPGLPGTRNITVIDLAFRAASELPLAWDSINDVPDRLSGSDVAVFVWPRLVSSDADSSDVDEIATFAKDAFTRRRALGGPASVCVLAHRLGLDPLVHLVGDPVEDVPPLVRSLQVRAMLDDGIAQLTPSNHHFRLPSGRHARSFVRVANMLRTPRDIWTAAAWLTPKIHAGAGLVLDTATLAPIATQVECFAEVAGIELGPIAILDRYPRSRLEVSMAVESAASLGGAMALLSVSSSGATHSYFEEALRTYAFERWSIDVVVASRPNARALPRSSRPGHTIWTEFESTLATDEGRCDYCADSALAHVVRIDERSFVPLAEPSPAIHMPSTDQSANSAFWEFVDATNAVELEAPPADGNHARAERVPLGVKINVSALARSPELVSAIARRLDDLGQPNEWKSRSQQRVDRYVAAALDQCRSSTVVFSRRPAGMDNRQGRAAIRRCLRALGIPDKRIHLSDKSLQNDPLKNPADVILCFAIGSVTGESLKSLRIEATDAYTGSSPEVNGLCLHARPPSVTEWDAIRNSFRPHRLAALWLSYLPWHSPLREEHDLLLRSEQTGPAVSHRSAYLANTVAAIAPGDYEESALLGANTFVGGQTSVRAESLYGARLGCAAAFAAVGSAIHSRRLEHGRKESAQRFMVDLPKVARSYYDAILMASVLRWTKPGEAWWGAGPSEEAETMRTMLRFGASTPAELAVLLPELLLAASLGKVPLAAIEELRTTFRSRLPSAAADLPRASELIREYFQLLAWARPEAMDLPPAPRVPSPRRIQVPRAGQPVGAGEPE